MRVVELGIEVPFGEAYELQLALHETVVAGAESTVLLLEHASVYTAGTSTRPHEQPFDGSPVVRTDRGGRITWHGPGQLVAYPIVALPEPLLVADWARRLEEAMIRSFRDFGVHAGRVEGRPGAWLAGDEQRPERKIGQIGVRVQRGVSRHGVSLNVDCDLAAFGKIVPCGIDDAAVTSIEAELGSAPRVYELGASFTEHLGELSTFRPFVPTPAIRGERHADHGTARGVHEPA